MDKSKVTHFLWPTLYLYFTALYCCNGQVWLHRESRVTAAVGSQCDAVT